MKTVRCEEELSLSPSAVPASEFVGAVQLLEDRRYADMLDWEIALRAAADAIIEDAANTPPPDHSKHRKTFLNVPLHHLFLLLSSSQSLRSVSPRVPYFHTRKFSEHDTSEQ